MLFVHGQKFQISSVKTKVREMFPIVSESAIKNTRRRLLYLRTLLRGLTVLYSYRLRTGVWLEGLCVRVTMAAKKAGKKKVAKKKIAKKKKGKKKAAKKPTKKRRKAKAKPISKRAARSRVWRGKLGKSKGGLTKAALTKNKHGKIVSRKASARAGKNKWIAAVVKVRKPSFLTILTAKTFASNLKG